MKRTVIVGGGAAGIPLAARLSEDASREILLLEAGPAPQPLPRALVDGTTVQAAVPGNAFAWSFPGQLTRERAHTVTRGRVLGGSSAINGGYFVRARPGDFSRWSEAGGQSWTYARALPVLRALETDHDFDDGRVHGWAGPMPVARSRHDSAATAAFIEAARRAGFADEPDKNAADPPGIGRVPTTIVDGTRISTATAYLPAVARSPNLSILADVHALRIRFTGSRAVGLDTSGGTIDADEIVLCAGGIGTPHLLLLSGIGPRAQLERLGIRVVSDLPVGAGFSDHPNVGVSWRARRPLSDPDERVAFPAALNLDSSGAAGRHREGDLEVLLSAKPTRHLLSGASPGSEEGDDLRLIVGLQSPEARGTIELRSADARVAPHLEYRYLQERSDRERLRIGVRVAADLLRSAAFEDLFAGFDGIDEATLGDDARLDDWVVAYVGTAFHLSGSAPMGRVVDAAGRVLGVRGLRVADTSMLPDVPSRGPYATAVFVGELIARAMREPE